MKSMRSKGTPKLRKLSLALVVTFAIGQIVSAGILIPLAYAVDPTADPTAAPMPATGVTNTSPSSTSTPSQPTSTMIPPSPLSPPTPIAPPSPVPAPSVTPPPTAPDYNPSGYSRTYTWTQLSFTSGRFDIKGTRNIPSTTDPTTGRTTTYGGEYGVMETWTYDGDTNSWKMDSRSGARTETEKETGADYLREDVTSFSVQTAGDVKEVLKHYLESKEVTSITGGGTQTVEKHHDWYERYDKNGAVVEKKGYERGETTSKIATTVLPAGTVSTIYFYENEKTVWSGPVDWTEKFKTDQKTQFINMAIISIGDGVKVSEKLKSVHHIRTFYSNGNIQSEWIQESKNTSEYFSDNGDVKSTESSFEKITNGYDLAGNVIIGIFEKRSFERDYYDNRQLREDRFDYDYLDAVTDQESVLGRVTNYRSDGSPESFAASWRAGPSAAPTTQSSLEIEWDANGNLTYVEIDGTLLTLPLSDSDKKLLAKAYRDFYELEKKLRGAPPPEAYPFFYRLTMIALPPL